MYTYHGKSVLTIDTLQSIIDKRISFNNMTIEVECSHTENRIGIIINKCTNIH